MKHIIEDPGDVPLLIVALPFRYIADVAGMIALSDLFDEFIACGCGRSPRFSRTPSESYGIGPAAADVAGDRNARRRVKKADEVRHVPGMNVVAYLLASLPLFSVATRDAPIHNTGKYRTIYSPVEGFPVAGGR